MLRGLLDLKTIWCSWGQHVNAELDVKCMAERSNGMVGCRRLCKTFRL